MNDLPTTTLLAGLVVALARSIEWLARSLASKRHERNGNGSKSAGLTANEWRAEIKEQAKKALEENAPKRHEDLRKLFEESEERLMDDVRNLMDNRTLTLIEKITDPIVKELRGLRDDLARRPH